MNRFFGMAEPGLKPIKTVIIPEQVQRDMQYFQAVQKGRQRAAQAQMKMFNLAGFSMLTLTTKKIDGIFQPVGQEELAAVTSSPDGYVAVIVDNDGYTKAQSKAVGREEALSVFKKLRESGMPEYPGREIQIWSESRPTVHKDS